MANSLSDNRELLRKLVESGKLVPAPTPQLPIPVPDIEPGRNPLSRGPLPSNMWTAPDATRQGHVAGVPQIRVMPSSPIGNPVTGAQAASQAISIVQSGGGGLLLETNNQKNASQSVLNLKAGSNISLSADANGGVTITGSGGLITAVNRQPFGSLDTSYQTTNVSVPGSITSISTTGVASSANTVALVVGDESGQVGGSPGAGWTSLGGGGEYFQIVPKGSVTATQTFGSGQNTACQVLCLFRGNGTTPTFTNRGSGSGGSSPKTVTFTPGAAGNSLLFINAGGGQHNNNLVVTDSQGNNWQTLQNAFAIDGPVGSSPANQINIAYAQNISGANTTVTLTFNDSLGTWIIYEVTNLLNISSGSYTLQSSDNDKMVLLTGGANIAVTLPSPALSAGWQALVVNDSGVGVDTLTPQSGALLNNLTASQTLQPGYMTWLFSDGTNYWLTNKVEPQAIAKQANQYLDSYSGVTGLFTQSQPAFSNISGNISTGQLNGGSGASATTFFRGDNSWSTISVSSTSQKSESGADTNVFQYFPPSVAGSYRIRFVMSVSAANAATLGWTATYKNSNGVAQTPTNLALYQVGVATPALTFTTSSAADYHGFVDVDIDNSGTSIIVKSTFTGTSFSAKVSASAERLI